MNSKGLRVLIAVVVVVGIAIFVSLKIQAKAKPKNEVGRTATVENGDITIKVSENGTLEPVTQVDVKSRVAGRILRIFVREGQTVKAGTPIADIDPTETRREYDSVKAQLDASRAGVKQSEENYKLQLTTNRLGIRRAEVNLETSLVGLKNAKGGLKDSEVGLQQAKAQFAQTSAPTRSQEVEQSEAAVRSSEASVADAERTLARRQALVAKGFVSQADADTAKFSLDRAKADLDSQKERLALLKEGPRREDVNTSRIGIDAAKVRVENARIQVENAEVQVKTAEVALETEKANAAQALLRYQDIERSRADVQQSENRLAQQSVQLKETRIVAPIAGEVIGKFSEEGELIASATAGFAQGAAVVSIADLSRMQVRVNINEVDVARVKVGHPVEVHVDGVGEQIFTGRVTAIAPASIGKSHKATEDQATASGGSQGVVRFQVKIAVDNLAKKLRPGMTAAVDIVLNKHKGVLILPAEALKEGDKAVVITGSGETLKKDERKLKIGLRNDSVVEVLDGLKRGDKVEIPKIDAKDRRKININGPD